MKNNLLRISKLWLLLFCGALNYSIYGMDVDQGDGPNAPNPSSSSSSSSSRKTTHSNHFPDGEDEDQSPNKRPKTHGDQDGPQIFPVPKPPTDLTALIYDEQHDRIQKALNRIDNALKWVLKAVEGGVLWTPFTWDEIMAIPDLKTKVLTDDRFVHLLLQYYIEALQYGADIPDLPFFDTFKEHVVKLAIQGSAVHQYFAGVILALGKRDIGRPPVQESEPVLHPLTKEKARGLIWGDYNAPTEEELGDLLNRVFYDNLRPRYDVSVILRWYPDLKDKVIGADRDILKVCWVLKCAKKMEDLSAIPGLVEEVQEKAKAGSEIDQYFVRELKAIQEYEENKKQSHAFLSKSADQGYAQAHFALTNFGKRFKDVIRDEELSSSQVQAELGYLKSAANLRYAPALYYLGLFHRIREGDITQSVIASYEAAKQGHPLAQQWLGGLYMHDLNGLIGGTKANPSVGFSWHWMSKDLYGPEVQDILNDDSRILLDIIQRNLQPTVTNPLWNQQAWKTKFEEILDQLDAIIPIRSATNQLNGGYKESQNAVVFLGDHYKMSNDCLGTCRQILNSLSNIQPLFMITDFVAKPGIDYTLKGEHAPSLVFIKPYEEGTVHGVTVGFRNVQIMDSLCHLKDILLPKVIASFQNVISAYKGTLQKQHKLALVTQAEIQVLEEMSKEKSSETATQKLEESRFKLDLANKCHTTLNTQSTQTASELDLFSQLLPLLKTFVIDGAGARSAVAKKAFRHLYNLNEDGTPIQLPAAFGLNNPIVNPLLPNPLLPNPFLNINGLNINGLNQLFNNQNQ